MTNFWIGLPSKGKGSVAELGDAYYFFDTPEGRRIVEDKEPGDLIGSLILPPFQGAYLIAATAWVAATWNRDETGVWVMATLEAGPYSPESTSIPFASIEDAAYSGMPGKRVTAAVDDARDSSHVHLVYPDDDGPAADGMAVSMSIVDDSHLLWRRVDVSMRLHYDGDGARLKEIKCHNLRIWAIPRTYRHGGHVLG
jgi:hypothetical protein